MSDQVEPSTTPNPPVITSATADAKPNGNQAKSNGKQNGKRGPEIRIPQAAFKQRLQREAAAEVKRRLGITIEEAEAIVKKTDSPQATSTGVANDVLVKLQQDKVKLQAEVDKQKRTVADLEAKHKKDVTRLRDKQTEAELKFMAKGAGVTDVDYAIHLFARAAAAGQTTDPTAFFGGLKGTHSYLFLASVPSSPVVAEAPPVAVPAVTAPLESSQPGETKPTPVTPTSATSKDASVENLSGQDFNRHMRSKYGYVPGMS
jgi:flagellar motor switch/type III secretory pathway protein FliN